MGSHFDDQVTASIGSIAIQQSNPDVIWVGTGEGNPRNSLNGGYGIFKSIDGGRLGNPWVLKKQDILKRLSSIQQILTSCMLVQ